MESGKQHVRLNNNFVLSFVVVIYTKFITIRKCMEYNNHITLFLRNVFIHSNQFFNIVILKDRFIKIKPTKCISNHELRTVARRKEHFVKTFWKSR